MANSTTSVVQIQARRPQEVSTALGTKCVVMGDIADRVKARRDELGLDQTELAERVGVSQQSIANIERRRTQSPRFLLALAHALDVDPHWLETGEIDYWGPSEAEFEYVPLYSAYLSAGPGAEPLARDEPSKELAFRRDWLKRQQQNPKSLVMAYASGDSMASLIEDGDVVLIDTAQREIRHGRVVAFTLDGDVRIKRLLWLWDGTLELHSDNQDPQYPNEHVPTDRIPELEAQIIGRVVWAGGDI